MNNLITAAYYTLLHSKHICKAVKDTGQVSALPVTQPASQYIHGKELRELRGGQRAVVVGKGVKRSQQNCTRSARHFREMRGHRGLRAAVVSFQLLVPWWSSWVSFSFPSNGFNCFLWGFCPCFYPAFEFSVVFTVFNLFHVLLWIRYFQANMIFPPSEASFSFVSANSNMQHVFVSV